MGTVHALQRLPQWTWADRVRKVRRDAGLSQAELADRLGVTRQAVGLWETGHYEPRDIVRLAQLIEREFGVSAAWMLGLLDGPGPEPTMAPTPRRGRGQSDRDASSDCSSTVIYVDFDDTSRHADTGRHSVPLKNVS